MDFERIITTTLTGLVSDFKIEITNTTGEEQWVISLIDYDDNVGAIGLFADEAEAISYSDAFFAIALPAYEAKHAKYGKMPTVTLVDGNLIMTLEDW